MDNSIKQQYEELTALRAAQELHRKQLEENRQRALAKRKQARKLSSIGQLVEHLLPDKTDAEITDILIQALAPYQNQATDFNNNDTSA